VPRRVRIVDSLPRVTAGKFAKPELHDRSITLVRVVNVRMSIMTCGWNHASVRNDEFDFLDTDEKRFR
jgi:hypothetical protein